MHVDTDEDDDFNDEVNVDEVAATDLVVSIGERNSVMNHTQHFRDVKRIVLNFPKPSRRCPPASIEANDVKTIRLVLESVHPTRIYSHGIVIGVLRATWNLSFRPEFLETFFELVPHVARCVESYRNVNRDVVKCALRLLVTRALSFSNHEKFPVSVTESTLVERTHHVEGDDESDEEEEEEKSIAFEGLMRMRREGITSGETILDVAFDTFERVSRIFYPKMKMMSSLGRALRIFRSECGNASDEYRLEKLNSLVTRMRSVVSLENRVENRTNSPVVSTDYFKTVLELVRVTRNVESIQEEEANTQLFVILKRWMNFTHQTQYARRKKLVIIVMRILTCRYKLEKSPQAYSQTDVLLQLFERHMTERIAPFQYPDSLDEEEEKGHDEAYYELGFETLRRASREERSVFHDFRGIRTLCEYVKCREANASSFIWGAVADTSVEFLHEYVKRGVFIEACRCVLFSEDVRCRAQAARAFMCFVEGRNVSHGETLLPFLTVSDEATRSLQRACERALWPDIITNGTNGNEKRLHRLFEMLEETRQINSPILRFACIHEILRVENGFEKTDDEEIRGFGTRWGFPSHAKFGEFIENDDVKTNKRTRLSS